MSENLPEPSKASDEVDLGQLLNAFGRLFDRFLNFIGSIFKFLFSIIVYSIKPIIDNFKLIAVVLIIAAALGFGVEKIKPDVYSSQMLVRPYFESKFQLINNINYYNALIDNDDYNTLANIFDVDSSTIKEVKSFDITFAPETENDRVLQYEAYIQNIDSVRAQEISYDDFVDNRSIYDVDFFEISVEAFQKDIFSQLEKGLNESFTNPYSINKRIKRDSLITIQKENIQEQINEADSLQKIYITVLEEEAKAPNPTISLGEGFSFDQEKSNTKEYDLLNKKAKLRDDLRKLDEQKVEDDVFFDVLSSFQKIGNKSNDFLDKYVLVFPIIAFVLLSLLFFASKIIKYVRKYEG